MAESTGTTPDYSLGAQTMRQVAQAGVGGEARESYLKSQMAGKVSDALVEGAEAYTTEKETREAEQEAIADAKRAEAKKWDTAFDAMGERGAWASGELFDQFAVQEQGFKDKYLEAVRTGDKTLQDKLLKEQGARSNSLQNWKETMETAATINKEYGWGEIINGDDPEAEANRKILTALAENKGEAKVTMDPETGEMGFELDGRIWTRREIDEMVASGTMPVVREEGFMSTMIAAKQLGAEGKDFEYDATFYSTRKSLAKELRTNPSSAKSIMRDVYAGETSLAQDLQDAIGKKDGGIQFDVQMPPRLAGLDQDGDGRLTAADLTKDNVDILIQAIQDDPKLLADVAGDWMTKKMQTNHGTAFNKHQTSEKLNRYYNMTAAQKEAFQAGMTEAEWLKFITGQ